MKSDISNSESEEYINLSREWKNSAGQKPPAFDFAEDLIIFLILLPILILPFRVLNSGTLAYSAITFSAVDFILLAFNRIKSRKIIYFVLFLFIITVSTITLSIICGNYVAAALSVIAAISSCQKLKKDLSRKENNLDREVHTIASTYMSNNTVIVGAIICYVSYMIAFGFHFNELMLLFIADYAAVFAAMLIYRHKSGAFCLSQWDKTQGENNAASSESKGKVTDAMFTLWTVLGTGAATLLVFLIGTLCGITRIDSVFLNFFSRLSQNQNMRPIMPKKVAPKPPVNGFKKYGHYKPSVILEIIGLVFKIFLFILLAVVVLIVIWLIIKAVFKMSKKLGTNINEERHSLISADDAVNSIKEQIRKIKRSFNIFSRGGSRMLIRRLFFIHVKKHGAAAVKRSDAPFEIGGKITELCGHDMSDASKIYEKARYSNDECNSDDVKRMRKALK